tara:strand:- start:331 stop:801 length:471 start_codon:yes stop_codon:yes gene_type:complete
MIKFPVPSASEVRPWLAQIAGQQEDIEELLQYANGRPLLALQLLETDLLERRRKFEGLIKDLSAQRISALSVAETCQENDPQVALDWLYSLLAEEAKGSRSGQNNISQRLIFRYMDRLTQAKRLAQSTANPNLLLLWEELLLNWQQLFSTRNTKKS